MAPALPLLCLLPCLFAAALEAQAAPGPTRPRIGLVLSGGGARGSAHVGVMQVLEELHVPIDFVAGTSMGAIVGGLYAYGLSPAQLEQLLTREGLDRGWDHLLRDGSPFAEWPFRRKEEARTYLSKARLGLRDFALSLPKGAVQGQNLETELRFLTLEAHELASFDELPLPFRCTGVDVHSGELVVLDRGNLADALRASMSIPGVFAPVQFDGHELVDGGLANNLPIDVARAMGATVLIVVDIGTPIDKDKPIDGFLAVAGQVLAILTQQNVDRSLATIGPDDLLIRPDLQDITSADFERAADAIALGKAAARAAATALQRWSVPAAEYERWLARQRRQPRPAPVLRSVQVTNQSDLGDAVIQKRLQVEPGQTLSEPGLRRDLERLFAIDDFQRVRFDVRNWRDDAADLGVTAELKEWGPSFVQFGLSLRSDFDRTSFQIAALAVAREVNSLGAEWRNVVEIGDRQSLLSEFYQPLMSSGLLFVAPRAIAVSDNIDLYANGDRVAEQRVDYAGAGIDLGAELPWPGEVRVGYLRNTGDTDVGLASQPVPEQQFDDGYLRAQLRLDTTDAAYFATRGCYGQVEYRWGAEAIGADADYQSLRGRAGVAWTGAGWTVSPRVDWDTTTAGTRPVYAEPTLGGFGSLSGLAADSLRGQHAAIAVLSVRRHLVDSVVPVYAGTTIEHGNVWQRRSDQFEDLILSGSLFLAIDLPLGPLYVGVALAEGEEVTGFLYLGPDMR